jgi:hypothetical protein
MRTETPVTVESDQRCSKPHAPQKVRLTGLLMRGFFLLHDLLGKRFCDLAKTQFGASSMQALCANRCGVLHVPTAPNLYADARHHTADWQAACVFHDAYVT